ncbi:ATP-dependent helicase [Halobacterium sp. KA-4]|uniref:ATP-dependent helicase n=1 Tax=Halobacterium sp. KA-4 TaxID=2896367 RepID=UPI001E610B65|nr:ATP-dependent helicase [Halobacterium sp. KA-4]MCD2199546.1 ATP-dependent helicase [Halobacterium sp. KA-4]
MGPESEATTRSADEDHQSSDREILDALDPAVSEWWVDRFGSPKQDGGCLTPPQREAIPLIHASENALVAAPTGSGKTLASFTAILNELFEREQAEGLDNAVHCLYVSPLKSLANDIERNLAEPLDGISERLAERGVETDVRQAIRHGDTSDYERQQMLEETPHILNTTPETLAILLNSPKFREKLRNVEYVVVDEIHSLADSKRGTHLSVSLERLQRLAGDFTRIGCSATVEPLADIARYLVGFEREEPRFSDEPSGHRPRGNGGEARDCEIVDARFARDYDLQLSCPTPDLVNASKGAINDAFYAELGDLIEANDSTLVFTNTRSGAERVLENLRERGVVSEDESACHHGSLSKDRRTEVEQQLKEGSLSVTTTSTSLELGIDMPHIDLVVQVGSPKSVASLLQRVGRAGHRPGRTVTGRVIALDRDELVECAVMLRQAELGFVDRVHIPERAHDVAAQHVYGMAIEGPLPEAEVRATLRSAYPYREYSDDDFEHLFRYLTADYDGLKDRNVYAKIWRDENDPPGGDDGDPDDPTSGTHHYPDFDIGERLIGKRGRLARPILLQNLGTIPDSFTVNVYVRGDDEWVGQLDESYLDTLEAGDVFVLGGDRFAHRYRRGSKVYVDRTSERATVPSWFSERLPLSYDLGREIAHFQADLLDEYEDGGAAAVRRWLREFPVDANAVRALARMYDDQIQYAGTESVSTTERIAIEEVKDRDEYRRRYHVRTPYGRRFNDGLSRLLAYRCANEANANVAVSVADNGFTLAMPLNRKVDVAELLRQTDPNNVREMLRAALDGTDLLQRYFRIDATRALLVLKRYKGREKSASKQQVASEMLLGFAEDLEDFAVLDETYRELIEDKLNLAGVREVLSALQSGDVEVTETTLKSPSPLSFGLATLSASDVVLADDEDAVLRAFHERVREQVDD